MKWVIVLLFSLEASAICMLESDAIVYGCLPIEDSQSTEVCQSNHGQDYKAFHASNICSPQLAAELRGEEYDSTSETIIITSNPTSH